MMAVRLGYWNIRAYAQPIRLLLAYTGTEVEEKRYNFIGPEWDRSEWLSEKFSHGLDFPNLPYYIDGDVKLSQTFAILKYLGRKHGLDARNEAEHIRIDLVEAEALDMRSRWVALCYGADFETNKPEYLKNLALKLKEMSDYLGTHNYFAGDHITYIDFLMYELLDQNSHMEPTALDEFPNLKAFHARIQGLDQIAAYMKSDKFLARPLNGPMAFFAGN